jgi:hypothetical protein
MIPLLGLAHEAGLALRAADHAVDGVLQRAIEISVSPARADSSAASLMRLARSAPVKPGCGAR